MADTIIILHGPYDLLDSAVGTLPEGEQAECGIIAPDGTVLETTFIGSHDGRNVIQGSGAQPWTGNISEIAGPTGMMVVQPTVPALRVNVGGTNWMTLTPASASPPAPPPGTVDGGTWV